MGPELTNKVSEVIMIIRSSQTLSNISVMQVMREMAGAYVKQAGRRLRDSQALFGSEGTQIDQLPILARH